VPCLHTPRDERIDRLARTLNDRPSVAAVEGRRYAEDDAAMAAGRRVALWHHENAPRSRDRRALPTAKPGPTKGPDHSTCVTRQARARWI